MKNETWYKTPVAVSSTGAISNHPNTDTFIIWSHESKVVWCFRTLGSTDQAEMRECEDARQAGESMAFEVRNKSLTQIRDMLGIPRRGGQLPPGSVIMSDGEVFNLYSLVKGKGWTRRKPGSPNGPTPAAAPSVKPTEKQNVQAALKDALKQADQILEGAKKPKPVSKPTSGAAPALIFSDEAHSQSGATKLAYEIRDDVASAVSSWNPTGAPAASPVLATKPKKSLFEQELVQWVWMIRANIEKAQAAGSRTKRVAGTRMIQAGIRLLRAGVNLPQVQARLLVGWTPDEIDKLVGKRPPSPEFRGTVEEGLFLVTAGFNNIFFCGPPGCGKTTLAGGIAEKLKLSFEAMPCFEELPASATFGRMTADGKYVPTAFTRIFEEGGVFLFDEIFKAAPAVSVALNMALANGRFYNPAAGREMKRHELCVILGASNSFGHGSAIFSTDQPQDPAFLDRFIGAAVKVDYDTEFELSLIKEE